MTPDMEIALGIVYMDGGCSGVISTDMRRQLLAARLIDPSGKLTGKGRNTVIALIKIRARLVHISIDGSSNTKCGAKGRYTFYEDQVTCQSCK